MMLIEDLLLSIKDDALPSTCSPAEAKDRILTLLARIEKRPMKSKEAVLFKEVCAETMKRFSLQSDDNLISLIDTRFSVEFIPSISSLGLQQAPEKLSLNSSDTDIVNKMKVDIAHAVEEAQQINIDSKRYYYLCSIRRQQTALYTTFRMYIDGTREIYENGSLGNPVMNNTPIIILGAKKFKNGSLPVASFVWDAQDIKQWKDKTAIGKCMKLPNNIYYGQSFLPVNENITSNLVRSSSLASVESDSSNIPAAVSVPVPDSPSSPSSRKVQTGIAEENIATSSGTVVSKQSASNRPISTRWSLRGTTGTLTPATSADQESAALSVMRDAIAVSVSCKGMEKLIHVNGVVVLPAAETHAAANASTGTDTDTGNAMTPISVPAVTERSLLDLLHAFTAATTNTTTTASAPATIPTDNLLYFRNKLPKKITLLNNNNKTVHSVEFSKISRVQTPSRKNIVIEEVPHPAPTATSSTGSSAGTSRNDPILSTEWTVDNENPSLLQVNNLGFIELVW